ncbi:23S rRNA (pseudouridine(1915)-N(3))-methyltransferase RlmH [candidate division KSB1 bacterium]|nr:23S rRNA (pseudouridine(1915)-N(3))-methyltransferase RlmH [candidate division KSB1 bacterium]
MKIRLIVVGATKANYIRMGEDDFIGRIRHYINFEYVVIKPEKIKKSLNESSLVIAESDRIGEHIGSGDWTVAMASGGRQLSSEELAVYIQAKLNMSLRSMTFVIGGPLGLSERFLERVSDRLSLSRMTLTHELARLVLLEQIYRAFTILGGEKYHK